MNDTTKELLMEQADKTHLPVRGTLSSDQERRARLFGSRYRSIRINSGRKGLVAVPGAESY